MISINDKDSTVHNVFVHVAHEVHMQGQLMLYVRTFVFDDATRNSQERTNDYAKQCFLTN